MHIGSVQWSYGSIIYYVKVFSIWKHYKLLSNLARNVKKQTFGLQQLIKGNGGVCVLKHFTSTTGVIQEYSKSFKLQIQHRQFQHCPNFCFSFKYRQ